VTRNPAIGAILAPKGAARRNPVGILGGIRFHFKHFDHKEGAYV